ncbi:acyltransferase family protein [Desulfofundulus sp.]|uniref:acyltransferase family protein n=1 Tax=Desulfofundulus sp. TaxID=2282750 RepID=UPI003C7646E9
MSKRDDSLDLLKTLACVLMFFAHSHVATDSWITHQLVFLGTFAPVIFFGVSGVTTVLQLRLRPPGSLSLFYVLFFFLGLSFVGAKGVNFWHEPQSEVLQGIALGVLMTIFFIYRLGPEISGFLFPLPFLLHLAAKKVPIPATMATCFLIPPGLFTLFPWLAFFLWGIFCYNHRRAAVLVTLGAGAAYTALSLHGLGHCEKWDMNIQFFLVGLVLYGVLAAMQPFLRAVPGWLVYLGRRSLFFFYAHYLLLYFWYSLGLPPEPALVWPVVLAGVVVLSLACDRLNQLVAPACFSSLTRAFMFWVLMLVTVLLSPVLVPAPWLIRISYLCGFLFALNYRQLLLLVLEVAGVLRVFPRQRTVSADRLSDTMR